MDSIAEEIDSAVCSKATNTEPAGDQPFAFYINACDDPDDPLISSTSSGFSAFPSRILPIDAFRDAVREQNLNGRWSVFRTLCGLVATFSDEDEAASVFYRMDVARVLGGPVQVAVLPRRVVQHTEYARWCNPHFTYKNAQEEQTEHSEDNGSTSTTRSVSCGTTISELSFGQIKKGFCFNSQMFLVKDVPWSIPIEDIKEALRNQFIDFGIIERSRQYIRIEVKNYAHSDVFVKEGFNFFGVSKFSVVPEKYSPQQSDGHVEDILQCYRCQGFWHVAGNCRHLPRCVRCGEPHTVELCPRPRSNPVCCHCGGPHHAAYKSCPVRSHLTSAVPVAFTLSKTRPKVNLTGSTPKDPSTKSTCML